MREFVPKDVSEIPDNAVVVLTNGTVVNSEDREGIMVWEYGAWPIVRNDIVWLGLTIRVPDEPKTFEGVVQQVRNWDFKDARLVVLPDDFPLGTVTVTAKGGSE